MAEAPKQIAVIGTGLPIYGRVVVLDMVRIDAIPRLEGAEVRLCADRPLGHGGWLRPGSMTVLAVREREGRIEALLPLPLSACLHGAASGDGVYFSAEVKDWEEREERAYVEAWKSGKEA